MQGFAGGSGAMARPSKGCVRRSAHEVISRTTVDGRRLAAAPGRRRRTRRTGREFVMFGRVRRARGLSAVRTAGQMPGGAAPRRRTVGKRAAALGSVAAVVAAGLSAAMLSPTASAQADDPQ